MVQARQASMEINVILQGCSGPQDSSTRDNRNQSRNACHTLLPPFHATPKSLSTALSSDYGALHQANVLETYSKAKNHRTRHATTTYTLTDAAERKMIRHCMVKAGNGTHHNYLVRDRADSRSSDLHVCHSPRHEWSHFDLRLSSGLCRILT